MRVANLSRVLRGRTVLLAIGAFAPFVVEAVPPVSQPYAVVARWKLPGTGSWDYLTLDPPRHRLFITRGDRVEVVDTESGAIVGRIPDTAGVHGVALAPEIKRGYTSNGRANTITEFDYDTLSVLRTVPVPGDNPDAILYEPAGGHLFTFNGRSKDATVYDVRSLSVVAKLPMPDKPEFAVDDGRGRVFVNIESEQGQMAVIDVATLAVTKIWPLPGCASPSGLAYDGVRERLFSVCDGKTMVVTNSTTGAQVGRVPIGEGPDAVAYDGAKSLVFSSNGEGSLTIVRADTADKYSVIATLATQRGARTMAFDPASRRIYLVTSDFGPTPAATPQRPHPRPEAKPDTFTVLVAAPR